MADISMCTNNTCPSRVHCYRYRARWGTHQSVIGFQPVGERCDDYISTSGYDDRYLTPMEDLNGRTATSSKAVGKRPKDPSVAR